MADYSCIERNFPFLERIINAPELTKSEYKSECTSSSSQFSLPYTLYIMLAAILSNNPGEENHKYSVQVKEHVVPEPRSDQAVVQIQAAALNHR